MATVKELRAQFTAQIDSLKGGLRNARTEFEKFRTDNEKTIKATQEKWKQTGDTMQAVGRGARNWLTIPITAATALSGKAAIDFESAFAGVRKTVDASEPEFAALEKGIRNMAKGLPATTTEISAVAEAAGQLGIKKENILAFSKTMIDLGESTNLTADQAATAFARFANITQMPQEQFENLGSSVVALGNSMATTEAEIVEMGMRLAGTGAQIGLSEAEIMALAASMSSVGIEAEAGGTAMSMVMKKMQNAVSAAASGSTADLDKFAQAAGMTSEEFANAFENRPIEAIDALIKGLAASGDNGENLNNILGDLGIKGIRESDTMLRLAGASDLLSTAVDTSTTAFSENVALTNEANQRYETTASKLAIFRNKVNDLGISFGQLLLPPLIKITEKAGDFIEYINRMDDRAKWLVLTMGGLAAAVGPVLMVVGGLVSAFAPLAGIIANAGGAAIVFKGALATLTGPVGMTVAAIAALTAGGIALVSHLKKDAIPEIDRFGDGVSEKTKQALQGFFDLSDGASESLMDMRLNGLEIGELMADELLTKYENMNESILRSMRERHKQELDESKAFFKDSSALSDEREQEVLADMQKRHVQKETEQQAYEDRIQAIVEGAATEKRAMTDEEYRIIDGIHQQMNENAVKYLSENEQEQKVILAQMAATADELSAQQAAAVVKNSAESRDKVIADAEKTYADRVAWAVTQRDETGTISAEEADKVIAEAKKTRDESVGHAEDMHGRVVEEAKLQAEGHVNHVDWETGEIKSKWEVYRDNVVGIFDGTNQDLTTSMETWSANFEQDMDAWAADATSTVEKWAADTEGWFASWEGNTDQIIADWAEGVKGRFLTWWDETSVGFMNWTGDVKGRFDEWKTTSGGTFRDWAEDVKGRFVDWRTTTGEDTSVWSGETKERFNNWKEETGETFRGWAGTAKEQVRGWKDETSQDVSTWAEENKQKFVDWKDNTIETGRYWAENWDERFENWAVNTGDRVGSWVENQGERFEGWSINTGEKIENWANNAGKTIEGWAKTAEGWFNSFDGNTGQIVTDWIEDMGTDFENWATDGAKKVETWASNVEDWFNSFDGNTTKTVDDWTVNVGKKIEGWANDTETEFQNWDGDTDTLIKDWAAGVKERFNIWWSETKTGFTNWGGDVKGRFVDWKETTNTNTRQWASEVKGRFNTWWAETKTGFREWGGDVKGRFKDWQDETWSGTKRWAGQVKERFLESKRENTKAVKDWWEDVGDRFQDSMDDIVKWVGKWPGRLGDQISKFGNLALNGIVDLNNLMSSGSAAGINAIIKAVNRILKEFGGSGETIGLLTAPRFAVSKGKVVKLAHGTHGHEGGPFLAGDGQGDNRGRELIRHPDGRMELSPDYPKVMHGRPGTQVFSAKETKAMFGGMVPKYADGTPVHEWVAGKLKDGISYTREKAGNVLSKGYDMLKDAANPKGLLDKVLTALGFRRPSGGGPIPSEMAGRIWDTVKKAGVDKIKNLISDFGFGDGGNFAPGSGNGFPGMRKSSSFGVRIHPITGIATPHMGDDWAAPAGTPIPAQAAGRVIASGYHGIRGNYVRIQSGPLQRIYQHNTRNLVGVGDLVKKGQIIGTVGSTGRSTGPHLHYEVLRNGKNINPSGYKDGGIIDRKTLAWLAEGGWAESVISHDPAKSETQKRIWEQTGDALGFTQDDVLGEKILDALERIARGVETADDISMIMSDRVVGKLVSKHAKHEEDLERKRKLQFDPKGAY